jgi:hypothetical protein
MTKAGFADNEDDPVWYQSNPGFNRRRYLVKKLVKSAENSTSREERLEQRLVTNFVFPESTAACTAGSTYPDNMNET